MTAASESESSLKASDELWPDRALALAPRHHRHTRSLAFFDHPTFEVLQAETGRRAAR
jgi:hypothetical protein